MSLDAQILSALRAAGPGAVSSAELSQKLGVSRTAIWARIEDLRLLGYEIEAGPHLGYRLVSAPDVLHADDLMVRLGSRMKRRDGETAKRRSGDRDFFSLAVSPTPRFSDSSPAGVRGLVIGRSIQVFQETTSTNDVVEKLARDGVKEGAVVFAESQTKGRGRLGRKWISPAGKGLWFSVLLRPQLRPLETTRLTVASATALRRAIAKQTGLQPTIKWPNDILVNGRKVAGILTELSAELDQVNYILLGIGVDVNLSPGELPEEVCARATSLKIELGKPVSRAELAVVILAELDRDYARMTSGDFAAVADEWEAHCATIGHEVVIRMGQRQIRGRAEALSEEGALLLRTEHGHLERIVGGDVTLECRVKSEE